MSLLKYILKPFASFRGRLLGIVSLGIISLALTASITAALVTGQRAADQMIAQGVRSVETLAEQSVLSLLYESPANAEKPLEAIMSFPSVAQAGIYYPDYSPLLTTGEHRPIGNYLDKDKLHQAKLVKETNTSWFFLAPVTVESHDDLFSDSRTLPSSKKKELLGYCCLEMRKDTLRDLQLAMILNNTFIALSFAIVLCALVNLGIDRMIRPLYKLIEVMKKNETEHTRVYAELNGPTEVTNIASVFNRMMSSLDERDRRLREHGEELETIVQLRTRELVAARDAALTASRHKSQFLANMSHELRTPLQAIIGYADVTREEMELEGFDEHSEGLNRVIHNATRLLTMINNILDMAKTESAKLDLKIEQVNLKKLLQEAENTVFPMLCRNNNQFHSKYHATTDLLQIDREKLLQMILNLLGNAGKFTHNGSVTLATELSNELLLISVSDTGIGIRPEEQQIIFEEFRQADGSSTRNFEGTGLGLAITKNFAEQMGGKITVDSELGKGATFTIHIPLPVKPFNAGDMEISSATESLSEN